MCSRVRYLLLCAFMILLCPLLSAAADLESAKRAYEDKDYAKALQEATPLVEQGNAEAQCLLGKMYWMGEKALGLRIALLHQRRRFLERFGVVLVLISALGGLEIRCGGKQRAKQDHESAKQ